MSVTIREFRRRDRDQLTELVNLHVAAVIPGVRLSTNAVLNQLEREPEERIVDPWVSERVCLVAVEDQAVVAAALVHRFLDDSAVADGYRGGVEIRWLIALPEAIEAGEALIGAAIATAVAWKPRRLLADGGSLPAPGCYGVPDSWPHVRRLLLAAGFEGPGRSETVLAAPCQRLLGHRWPETSVRRSVGPLGTRLDLWSDRHGESCGHIEVAGVDAALARSVTGAIWADVANLVAAEGQDLAEMMPPLFSAAAQWLLLGGVDRLIDYYAEDFHSSDYLDALLQLGFVALTTNGRAWELPL